MIDLDASLDELRLVYRVLKEGLGKFPELMDCGFFEQLQSFLQKQASEEGVDVSDHEAWSEWLSGDGDDDGNEEVPEKEWGVN